MTDKKNELAKTEKSLPLDIELLTGEDSNGQVSEMLTEVKLERLGGKIQRLKERYELAKLQNEERKLDGLIEVALETIEEEIEQVEHEQVKEQKQATQDRVTAKKRHARSLENWI